MKDLGAVSLRQAVDTGLLGFYASPLDNADVFKRSNAWSQKHIDALERIGVTVAGDLVTYSEAELRITKNLGAAFVREASFLLMEAFNKIGKNSLPDFVLKDNGTMGHMLGVTFDESLTEAIQQIKIGQKTVAMIETDLALPSGGSEPKEEEDLPPEPCPDFDLAVLERRLQEVELDVRLAKFSLDNFDMSEWLDDDARQFIMGRVEGSTKEEIQNFHDRRMAQKGCLELILDNRRVVFALQRELKPTFPGDRR